MTLEQTRARTAYKHVRRVAEKGPKYRDDYGGMALKLPALVRTAGLCQALHFVLSRNKRTQEQPREKEQRAHDQLLDDLGEQLKRVDPAITNGETLCKRAREAELLLYLQLTREAVATLQWYARLARSELNLDPAQVLEE